MAPSKSHYQFDVLLVGVHASLFLEPLCQCKVVSLQCRVFDTMFSDFHIADEGLQDMKFMSYWLEPVPSFKEFCVNRVVFKVSQKLLFGKGIFAPILTL